MPALGPSTGVHRDYEGSEEYVNGLPPTADQIVTGDEFNNHTETLQDHKEHIDAIYEADYDFVSDFNTFYSEGLISPPGDPLETDFVAVFDTALLNTGD